MSESDTPSTGAVEATAAQAAEPTMEVAGRLADQSGGQPQQMRRPARGLLANEAAIDLADLEDDPLLFSGGSCEQPIRDLYRREGLHLRPTHRVRELSTLFSMVRSGLGVAVLPSLVRAMLDDTLVLVPLLRTHRRRLFLTGPTSEPWRSTVSALIDSIDHERTY